MTPNCENCNNGEHEHCTARYPGDCECAVRQHGDQERERVNIPQFAMTDLYMALGFDSENFEAEYTMRGYAGMWAWLLARVRDLNDGLKNIEREETAAAASLGIHRSYPALIEAALRDIKDANITGVSVTYESDSLTAYYTFTVEGR